MEQFDPHWKRKAILFFVSQGISLFGSTLVSFALVWYVTLKTSSGAWVAALTVCSLLPQTLISFISGAWADRYSKKMLIILSDAAIAVATLALALLLPFLKNDGFVLTALLIAAALRSVGAGIQLPAVNAMTPHLVPQEHLMRINGANATLQSAIQFAAPAAAGAILSLSSLRSTLFVDIGTAAAGIGLLACLSLPAVNISSESQPSGWTDIKSGFQYLGTNRFLLTLMLLFGAFIFLSVPGGFLASLLVTRTYGGSYFSLTLTELFGFAGMAAGGLLLSVWGGFPNRVKTLLCALFLCGVFTAGLGAVHNFYLYLAIMVFLGAAITISQTAVTTLIQERIELNLQGRVFGLMGAVYSGFLLFGMTLFGPAADSVSLSLLMILTGVALALLALAFRFNRRFYRQPAQERRPEG